MSKWWSRAQVLPAKLQMICPLLSFQPVVSLHRIPKILSEKKWPVIIEMNNNHSNNSHQTLPGACCWKTLTPKTIENLPTKQIQFTMYICISVLELENRHLSGSIPNWSTRRTRKTSDLSNDQDVHRSPNIFSHLIALFRCTAPVNPREYRIFGEPWGHKWPNKATQKSKLEKEPLNLLLLFGLKKKHDSTCF